MLSTEEKAQIDEELAHVPTKQAACIGALKVVQKHRRWVDDQGIADVAEYLDMSREELDSVATFYNLIFRRPVGRRVILICDSVSCWIMGYDRIREHLTARLGIRLGETSHDGEFTMLPIACLGVCDHAPALMINDELYRDLEPQKLDRVLESDGKTAYRKHSA